MNDRTVLKTAARPGSGSRVSRAERREGRVPVVVYGHGEGNASLSVPAHELEMALKTTAQVFTLDIGGKQETCLIKEVQYDTYGMRIQHVDFARVDLSEEVAVDVAVEPRGLAKGLAGGGQQIVLHNTVPVRCRADAIPEILVADVTELEVGDSVHARELVFPAGVTLDDGAMNPDEAIVTVQLPKRVEVEEPEEGEEGAEGAEGAEAAEGGEAKAEGGEGGAAPEGGDG